MFSTFRYLLCMFLLCLCTSAWAAPRFCSEGTALKDNKKILKVGVKYAPPFVFNSEKKGWEGLSIELWETISLCLGIKHEYIEFATSDELVDAVENNTVDLGIAALSVTEGREKRIDFSHGYYNGSLGAVVPDVAGNRKFIDVIQRFFRLNVLLVIFGLLVSTFVIAYTYWRLESKQGNKFFTDGPLKGFYHSAIWAVQLVFSGRGDPYAIRTRPAQLFVLFLTFFGVTIVSGITAVITSSLTLQGIEWHIQNVSDLKKQNISVMSSGVAKNWAMKENLYVTQLRSWAEVQRKFDEKAINVFVHDRDILQFLVKDRYLKNLRVEPLVFKEDPYAIALPEGSPLLEPINRSVLSIKEDKIWENILSKYFGSK